MAERAPDPTTQADDEPDEQVPAPERGPLTDDPEVPEADALEQSEEVVPRPALGRLPDDPEVPEADAWEQSLEVPFDDEEPV